MKIIQRPRKERKTNDIFWLAHENQPSVILVPNQQSKDLIEKKYFEYHPGWNPDIKIEIFRDYIYSITGQHYRNIFVDDLDVCLKTLFDKDIKVASFTEEPICSRALKEGKTKELDDKTVCAGYIYGMNFDICRNCDCCPHQYGHPFDKFWENKKEYGNE